MDGVEITLILIIMVLGGILDLVMFYFLTTGVSQLQLTVL